MKTVVAAREDFFTANGCPVALRAIRGDRVMQHEGDLTDVRHTHDFAELIVVSGGGGRHWIDGEIYDVSEGDVFLIQGKSEHYFIERHDLSMFNVMFDESYLKDHLKSLYTLPGFNAFFLFEPTYRKRHRFQSHLHLDPETMYPLEALLRQMLAEQSSVRPGFDLMLLSRVLEIFVMISREYSRNESPKARSLFSLGTLIAKLEKEYTQKWTLRRLSKIAGMAPSTLSPCFKNATGYSPIDYLLRVRLTHAAEMLRTTAESVSAVAEQNGFPDSNYFSRQFRRVYRASPREYRKKAR